MLYSFLIYEVPEVFESYSDEEKEQVMQKHRDLQAIAESKSTLCVAQLMPTSTAVTVRADHKSKPITLDGPFAETKELFMGIYAFDCGSLDEAIAYAEEISDPCHTIEVRPVKWAGGALAS